MTDRRPLKQIHTGINQLKNIGPTSNAQVKFIVDTTPFDDDNENLPSGDWIITGRLLPNSDLYKQGSIRVRIILGTAFPGQPPKVFLDTNVYHPNVDKKGEVSIALLSSAGKWTLRTSLVQVVEEVTDIIDKPSTDLVQNAEAASHYINNKKEYERIALETFRTNCASRK